MPFHIKLSLLTALAGLLVLGVLFPEHSYSVLSTPAHLKQAREQRETLQKAKKDLIATEQLAGTGDAEAMFKLGMSMRSSYSYERVTGETPDSLVALNLIRSSAELGHFPARIAVWHWDGQDPGDLIEIAKDVSAQRPDFNQFYGLLGWLHWTGIEGCDKRFLDQSRSISAYVDSLMPRANGIEQQERFEIAFQASCI